MKIKKLFLIMACCLPLCVLAACQPKNQTSMNDNNKTLVAYFSATGTTMEAATKLAKVANADLHEIVPETRYTPADLNWQDKNSRRWIRRNRTLITVSSVLQR